MLVVLLKNDVDVLHNAYMSYLVFVSDNVRTVRNLRLGKFHCDADAKSLFVLFYTRKGKRMEKTNGHDMVVVRLSVMILWRDHFLEKRNPTARHRNPYSPCLRAPSYGNPDLCLSRFLSPFLSF